MKILSGSEIAGYMKENQAHLVRSLKARKIQPKLVIIRDSENPVIAKYVSLKCRYGADIGVVVEDWLTSDVEKAVEKANSDPSVHGVIVQLPLKDKALTDFVVSKIAPEKDVDGLSGSGAFDSATATAINWLLAGYDIQLAGKKIALVGRGRLVGAPLEKMWRNSGYDVAVFNSKSDPSNLINYQIIVTATGVPHLIKSDMVRSSAVIVDAGTASEDGVLVGDVDEGVRARTDLAAITPKLGGVGPLTVTALFEHVLIAAGR